MAPDLFSIFAALLVLVGMVCPANTQALGSFYFGRGSAVVLHNPDAGNFLYSINSAKGFGDLQSLEVKAKPKNGTAVACTGYSGPTSVYGQVFYQSVNSSLAFLFFKCSYASGICVNYGEYIISSNVTTPVSPNTQLAAALFSKDIGYRVTYQDINGSLRQLAYANNTQGVVTNWADGNVTGNVIVPDGYAVSTTYVSPSNITVLRETIYGVGEGEIRVSSAVVENKTRSIHDQKTWVVGPSIPNLPSFIPSLAHLATFTYNSWDCLFYIDNTSHLQFMRSTDGGLSWSLQPQMDLSSWPLADKPNAPLTASTSFNSTDNSAYIYYQSGGKLIQARIRNSLWEPAQAVQAPPNGTFVNPNNVPKLESPKDKDTLTSTLKLKIGVGTGVAVAFIIILAVLGCHFRRVRIAARRVKEIEKPNNYYNVKDNGSSEHGFTGKAELCGVSSERMELDHDPECRLLHQLQARRLGELEGGLGCGMVRGELEAWWCSCELDGGRKVFCELASPVSELGCGLDRDEGSDKIDDVIIENGVGNEKEETVISELAAGSVKSRRSVEKENQTGVLDEAGNRNCGSC
ncbi:hypothetical protein BKA65DRAFT_239495 [Rhexocercosporidium sp. MPI-PUGE-AT-0058]|nr:hypothetical protein BKA65DRAFT_239495 [Rhexocercosporidium sp. MPI-PUGE-AT-0058]